MQPEELTCFSRLPAASPRPVSSRSTARDHSGNDLFFEVQTADEVLSEKLRNYGDDAVYMSRRNVAASKATPSDTLMHAAVLAAVVDPKRLSHKERNKMAHRLVKAYRAAQSVTRMRSMGSFSLAAICVGMAACLDVAYRRPRHPHGACQGQGQGAKGRQKPREARRNQGWRAGYV